MEGKLSHNDAPQEIISKTALVGKPLSELIKAPETRISEKMKMLFTFALREHPVLNSVRFTTFEPQNEYDAGGYYEIIDDAKGTPTPIISISEGGAELLKPIMISRRHAIRMNAELLGINPDEMTPDLLLLFIIAHELGHAKDFLQNYLQDPNLNASEAAEEMDMHRSAVLGVLPVIGMDPSSLNSALHRVKNLEEAIAQFPEIKKHPRFHEMRDIEDLKRIQETEYRASPPESYADQFAVTLLKNNFEALGFARKS